VREIAREELCYDSLMTARAWLLLGALFIVAQAGILYLLGQPATCECGFVKVWESAVLSSGNSQHLSDWYSFSHIIHGVIFYALLTYFFPRMPLFARFAFAVGIEVAWEILENTPMVIEHYRLQALAQGYVGDSILNSVSDTLMMVGGFVLAWRLPVWASVALCVLLEVFVMYMIRDGLALNILGFVYTPEFIASWQSSAQ